VSQKLILYCIVNLLHEHKLACPEYLTLATKPEELIDALYKDSSIVDRFVVGVGNYPGLYHLKTNNLF
jgi:Rough deal protein C-terminal region